MNARVNFTNIFMQCFYACRSQRVKIQSSCQYLLQILRSACVKASFKILMKLTPGFFFLGNKYKNKIKIFKWKETNQISKRNLTSWNWNTKQPFVYISWTFCFVYLWKNKREKVIRISVDLKNVWLIIETTDAKMM